MTHTRLKTVPPNLCRLTKVEVMNLRQNMLKDVTSLMILTTLKELDLYDNELTEIPDLSKLERLE